MVGYYVSQVIDLDDQTADGKKVESLTSFSELGRGCTVMQKFVRFLPTASSQ
jgi:hypothetical protein